MFYYNDLYPQSPFFGITTALSVGYAKLSYTTNRCDKNCSYDEVRSWWTPTSVSILS